jgi:hypothetical protein
MPGPASVNSSEPVLNFARHAPAGHAVDLDVGLQLRQETVSKIAGQRVGINLL